jgi:hypothetical protein
MGCQVSSKDVVSIEEEEECTGGVKSGDHIVSLCVASGTLEGN